MNSDVLAPRWMLNYFQVFGLHLPDKTRSIFHAAVILIILIADFIISMVFILTTYNGSTVKFVGFIECKWSEERLLWENLIDFFKGSLFLAAISSSVLCASVCQKKKTKLIEAFKKFDLISDEDLSSQDDHRMFNIQTKALFVVFWLSSFVTAIVTLYINWNSQRDQFLYMVKVTILTHVLIVESFQMFVFTNGVRRRLQISVQHLKKFLWWKKLDLSRERLDYSRIRNEILEIFEINQQVNCWFKFPLLFVVVQNYTSLLTYAYWTFASFLGLSWSFGVPVGKNTSWFIS